MNNKDFDNMRRQHLTSVSGDIKKNSSVKGFGLSSILNKRLVTPESMKEKSAAEKTKKEEPKSAIWWMIMIFCLVYGFEIFYKTLLTGQVPQ